MGVAITCSDTDFRDEELPHDNPIMKGLSCVPVVGSFVRMFANAAIDSQIVRTTNASRLIRLIDLKNDYHVCSVARCIMTVALPIFWNFLGIIWILISVAHQYAIRENLTVIKELANTGYRPDLKIY